MNSSENPLRLEARVALVKQAVRNAIATARVEQADRITEVLLRNSDGVPAPVVIQAFTDVLAEKAEEIGSGDEVLRGITASLLRRLQTIRTQVGS
jgi:hypothetical protein